MTETKQSYRWIVGEMGQSETDGTIFYVRTEACSALEAMTEGPDVCLCTDRSIAHRIAHLPTLEELAEEALAAFDGSNIQLARDHASVVGRLRDVLVSLSEAR